MGLRLPASFLRGARAAASESAEQLRHAVDLLQFGAFVAFVNNYVVSVTQCIGPSMLPTISTQGDVVLTRPLHGRWLVGGLLDSGLPERGQARAPPRVSCRHRMESPSMPLTREPSPVARAGGHRRVSAGAQPDRVQAAHSAAWRRRPRGTLVGLGRETRVHPAWARVAAGACRHPI